MSAIDLDSYKQLYIKTAREYLVAMRESLQTLQQQMDDREALEILHRSAHSIASQSLVMQYKKTGELGRSIEHVLKSFIDANQAVTMHIVQAVSEATEELARSITAIEKANEELDVQSVTAKMKALI